MDLPTGSAQRCAEVHDGSPARACTTGTMAMVEKEVGSVAGAHVDLDFEDVG